MRAFLLLVGLGFVLCGCAQSPTRTDSFYRLDLPSAQRLSQEPAIAGVLEISRLDVDGVISQRSLAYVDQRTPVNIQSYRYELWADTPGSLVQGELVEFMREANLARMIVTPDARATPDYTLRGRIKRFEQVLSGGSAKGIAEIEFTMSARDGRLVLLKRYEAQAPAGSETPQAAVAAITQAVATIASELARDMVAATRR